jgi:PTH1 family peptidyl-tRNA hydrolase
MQGILEFWRRWRDRSGDSDRSARRDVADQNSEACPGRLIVGLGNPGEQYKASRHNIGFRVVELLADRFAGQWRLDSALDARICRIEIGAETCLLVQPQSFMNRSGTAIRAVLARWPECCASTDLLIVYDDLDLPLGRIRLRPRGGPGGHRGIGDIIRALETNDLPRLRIGVGHPGSAADVTDWVLASFSATEESEVLPGLLAKAADAIEATIRDGLTPAMGYFNTSG